MYKNRWIRIVKNEKIAYAQWEDVGPFNTDDKDYAFGTLEMNLRIKVVSYLFCV